MTGWAKFRWRNSAGAAQRLGMAARDELERKVGYRLPDDYCRCVEEHEGGTPVPATVCILARPAPFYSSFSVLLPWSDPDEGVALLLAMLDTELPRGLFPFGADANGDLFLLDLRTQPCPVLFWIREQDVFVPLARSFGGLFVHLARVESQKPRPRHQVESKEPEQE